MKETYCLFLPADVAVVEEFVLLMSKAGVCFDRDYTIIPSTNIVKVATESQEQFNIIRRNIAQVLTKDMQ